MKRLLALTWPLWSALPALAFLVLSGIWMSRVHENPRAAAAVILVGVAVLFFIAYDIGYRCNRYLRQHPRA